MLVLTERHCSRANCFSLVLFFVKKGATEPLEAQKNPIHSVANLEHILVVLFPSLPTQYMRQTGQHTFAKI